jgi:hypothetical protein
MEGLYKLTYNGEAPKKETQIPSEESDTHVTEEYHVKRNKICPKELIQIQYDFLKPEYRLAALRANGIRIRDFYALNVLNQNNDFVDVRPM